ncbi:hypothetical protein [Klebsiella aerogenes]|uniref:hypothetical protein n=1 Tax=Klebsiella aerogenes TaxID=548 RepID=UPI003D324423
MANVRVNSTACSDRNGRAAFTVPTTIVGTLQAGTAIRRWRSAIPGVFILSPVLVSHHSVSSPAEGWS